ncbi:MAG: c-type cytochrome domain-containing protein, partial [Verrucomicrobiota bacterium]
MKLFLAIALFTSWTSFLLANDDPASEIFFENRIRPVLVEQCYECHSIESGKSKGGLLVDSRESIRQGGDTGSAVVPNDPEGSLLLTAIRHEELDLEMPPK